MLHVLLPDGVRVTGADGNPTFVAADPPTDEDIQHLVESTAQRLVRLLERRGLLQDEGPDPLAQEQPLLAALTAASLQGRVATGPRAGARLGRRLADPATGQRTAPLCYAARGFSLHAATRMRCLDPQALSFALKTPRDDGTTALVVSAHELLERLAALVPPPHLYLIRYHGVLAAQPQRPGPAPP